MGSSWVSAALRCGNLGFRVLEAPQQVRADLPLQEM